MPMAKACEAVSAMDVEKLSPALIPARSRFEHLWFDVKSAEVT